MFGGGDKIKIEKELLVKVKKFSVIASRRMAPARRRSASGCRDWDTSHEG